MVVVSANGAIDAANAHAMTDYALGHAMSGRGLILDLSGLNFLGTEGFTAIHRVAVGCARTSTAWSLVTGPAVRRLLRICDPHGALGAADTVDAARATVAEQITLCRRASRTPGIGTTVDMPTTVVR